mmetsp:Transcript_47520/g.137264  ORF Transcript_47520/g.137264 Transcript_47520/m.137264 type:complete len:271 (+) Transcript_47520:1626-2438(+)
MMLSLYDGRVHRGLTHSLRIFLLGGLLEDLLCVLLGRLRGAALRLVHEPLEGVREFLLGLVHARLRGLGLRLLLWLRLLATVLDSLPHLSPGPLRQVPQRLLGGLLRGLLLVLHPANEAVEIRVGCRARRSVGSLRPQSLHHHVAQVKGVLGSSAICRGLLLLLLLLVLRSGCRSGGRRLPPLRRVGLPLLLHPVPGASNGLFPVRRAVSASGLLDSLSGTTHRVQGGRGAAEAFVLFGPERRGCVEETGAAQKDDQDSGARHPSDGCKW